MLLERAMSDYSPVPYPKTKFCIRPFLTTSLPGTIIIKNLNTTQVVLWRKQLCVRILRPFHTDVVQVTSYTLFPSFSDNNILCQCLFLPQKLLSTPCEPILSGPGRGKPCDACAIIIGCEKERLWQEHELYDMSSSHSLQQLFHARQDSKKFSTVYDAMYEPPTTPPPTHAPPSTGLVHPCCMNAGPNNQSDDDDDVVDGFIPESHDDPDMPALNPVGESDSDDEVEGFVRAAMQDLSTLDATVPVDPSAFDPDVPVIYDSDDDLHVEGFTIDENMPLEVLAAMDTDAMYLSMSDGIDNTQQQPNSNMNLHTCKHCGAWLYRFIVRGKMNVETCFCGSKGSVALDLRRSFPLKPLPPAVLPLYTSGKLARDSSKFNGLLGMTGLTLPSDPSIKGQNHPRFNAGFKIKGTALSLHSMHDFLLPTSLSPYSFPPPPITPPATCCLRTHTVSTLLDPCDAPYS